jgi:hypothetical protein
VFRNPEKSVLLLPPSVPPDTEVLNLFPNHTVTYDGFILMGKPVETDKYIAHKSANKSKSVLARTQIIRKFGQQAPCIALKLLAYRGMDYITRTVPPRLLTETASIFDSAMFDTVIGILSPSGAVFPRTETSCLERVKNLVHLPYRHVGLDLIKLVHKSPVAYYGCSLQIAGDPNIREQRVELVDDLVDSYESIIVLLPTNVLKAGHALTPVLSPNSTKLLDGSFSKDFLQHHSKCKAIKVIGNDLSNQTRMDFREEIRMSTDPVLSSSDRSDFLPITS